MNGLIRDTFLEAHDRKMTYLFGAITLVGAFVVMLSRGFEFNLHIESQGMDPSGIAAALQDPILRMFKAYLSFLLFLAVMASAGHIPAMLEKGRAEYYLSKPISRRSLLMGKWFAVFVTYGSMVGGSGLIIYSLVSLMHQPPDLRILFLFTMYGVSLAMWVAITTCAAVLSGSTVMSIMTAFFVWVAAAILSYHDAIKAALESPTAGNVVDTLYYLVPKASAVEQAGFQLALGRPVDDWWAFVSTVLVGAAILQAAVMILDQQDY